MGRRLQALERHRTERPSGGSLPAILRALAGSAPESLAGLIRLHEALLFHAAHPESARVARAARAGLARVAGWTRSLRQSGRDLSGMDLPDAAGIGGTEIGTTFTFDFLRALTRRHPGAVRIDWEAFSGEDRLGAGLPRAVPLLEEEALADANVPYRAWLQAARGRKGELEWLIERFENFPLAPRDRAELFDALAIPVTWELSLAASRSGAFLRKPRAAPFLHRERLLARRDVDLRRILGKPALSFRPLPAAQARRRLDLARDASGSRYRELYGFTYGDPETALVTDAGRGCEISLFGLPPDRRLPIRSGYAALVVKNGVPVAYVEGLALFERIEVGFNVYYTFRDGESAWIYAQVLKVFREALGVTSFSVDPYQVGFENEEAIASGAFWFYRKLGFQSASSRIRDRTDAESRRLKIDPSRRTSSALLRRLALRNLLFDSESAHPPAEWENFHVRNIGLAVGRRVARRFGGDPLAARRAAAARVGPLLGVDHRQMSGQARSAFDNLALLLDLVPGLPRWSPEEKSAAAGVLRAKSGRRERTYLDRMRRHEKLRAAFLKLGSSRGNDEDGGF